jgi:hypothetical protein
LHDEQDLFESGKIKRSRRFLRQIRVTLSAVFSQIKRFVSIRQVFTGGKKCIRRMFERREKRHFGV